MNVTSVSGDSGYPLQHCLLTPFANPASEAEQRYNNSHAKTRVVVEQAFGILKSRFRCLHKSGGSLQYTPVKCSRIILACILLHNRCIRRDIPLHEVVEHEDPVPVLREVDMRRNLGVAKRMQVVRAHFS